MTIPARESRVEEHVEHEAMSRGRVVVADDDVLVREGVVSLLQRSGFDVVGQAGDAAQLLDLVGEHLPDLVIIDIRMPPTHRAEGLVAAHHIRKEFSDIGIVLLSAYVQVNDAIELLASCDRVGYLLKSRVTDVNEFIDTLGRIMKGGSVVDPSLVMELLNAVGKLNDASLATRVVKHEALEIAVMCLSPMIPHVAHELWRELGHGNALIHECWWQPDREALVQDTVEISVQVNGKMRARVSVPADATQEMAVQAALADANVQKFIEGKPIRKAIYVPGKLANLVV